MGHNERYSLGDTHQIALRNCSEEVEWEGQYVCDFGERDTCAQTPILAEGCC